MGGHERPVPTDGDVRAVDWAADSWPPLQEPGHQDPVRRQGCKDPPPARHAVRVGPAIVVQLGVAESGDPGHETAGELPKLRPPRRGVAESQAVAAEAREPHLPGGGTSQPARRPGTRGVSGGAAAASQRGNGSGQDGGADERGKPAHGH